MKKTYYPLFRIEIRHGFYADGKSSDIEIVPTALCRRLMQRYDLRLRRVDNETALFFGEVSGRRAPIRDLLDQPDGQLSFMLQLTNPDFRAITDLPDLQDNEPRRFYFDNRKVAAPGLEAATGEQTAYLSLGDSVEEGTQATSADLVFVGKINRLPVKERSPAFLHPESPDDLSDPGSPVSKSFSIDILDHNQKSIFARDALPAEQIQWIKEGQGEGFWQKYPVDLRNDPMGPYTVKVGDLSPDFTFFRQPEGVNARTFGYLNIFAGRSDSAPSPFLVEAEDQGKTAETAPDSWRHPYLFIIAFKNLSTYWRYHIFYRKRTPEESDPGDYLELRIDDPAFLKEKKTEEPGEATKTKSEDPVWKKGWKKSGKGNEWRLVLTSTQAIPLQELRPTPIKLLIRGHSSLPESLKLPFPAAGNVKAEKKEETNIPVYYSDMYTYL